MAVTMSLGFMGRLRSDETYIGGRRRNMSNAQRAVQTGRGPVGKSAVVGLKDRDTNEVRAKTVNRTDAESLQGFIVEHADAFATVYTDDA